MDSYDWSPLGGCPTPGDPGQCRTTASQLGALAHEVAFQNSLLRQLADGTGSVWAGPAAAAFEPHLSKIPPEMDKLAHSYSMASEALATYALALADAQALAVSALAKAKTAQSAISAAQAQVSSASQAVASATSDYNSKASSYAGKPDPTGAHAWALSALQGSVTSAQAGFSQAQGALDSANAMMAAAKSMAAQARSQAKEASARAASSLGAASKAGIQNPHRSWWDSVVDDVEGVVGGAWHWTEHHWQALAMAVPGLNGVVLGIEAGEWLSKHIVQVAEDASLVLGGIATVAGLLALVPGIDVIALPVAMAAAGLQTVDDVALWAAGKGSGTDVLFDVAGDLSFGVGGGLAKLGEGADELARATSESSRLADEISPLEKETSQLTKWGQEIHGLPGEVPSKVASGWRQASEEYSQVQARIAENETKIEALTGQRDTAMSTRRELSEVFGEANPMAKARYAARELLNSDKGISVPRMAKFFKEPQAYISDAMDNLTRNGQQSLLEASVNAGKEQLGSGAGRFFYRVNYALGAASTGVATRQEVVHIWGDSGSSKQRAPAAAGHGTSAAAHSRP